MTVRLAGFLQDNGNAFHWAGHLFITPPALVLDEPTNALDVVGSRDLLDTLDHLRERGHAILLSTHRLHEIEHKCDRFVIINKGHIAALGTRDALVADSGDLESAFFHAIDRETHA